MAQHKAAILWERGEQRFLDGHYSRRHILRFDGDIDIEVPASSSPHLVQAPLSHQPLFGTL